MLTHMRVLNIVRDVVRFVLILLVLQSGHRHSQGLVVTLAVIVYLKLCDLADDRLHTSVEDRVVAAWQHRAIERLLEHFGVVASAPNSGTGVERPEGMKEIMDSTTKSLLVSRAFGYVSWLISAGYLLLALIGS